MRAALLVYRWLMGSRWKNKGQGGGVSWGNKDSKIAQQKKKQVPRSAEAAAKARDAGLFAPMLKGAGGVPMLQVGRLK